MANWVCKIEILIDDLLLLYVCNYFLNSSCIKHKVFFTSFYLGWTEQLSKIILIS